MFQYTISRKYKYIFIASTIGKDFYLGIPPAPERLSPVFELMIGTPFGQASYAVELAGNIVSGTTLSSKPATVNIDSTFEVTASSIKERMRGIRVQATGENPIYVLVSVRYSRFFLSGYASYLVHPNNEFKNIGSYEYFAMSTDYAGAPAITNRRSNILLVGNQNETSISIIPTQTVTLPVDAQRDRGLVEVAAGTTHNVTLGRLQTLGFSSLLDLTGTKIVSDKPLTVLTGHQCAQVPITAFFCEPLYVHVPPTVTWGQVFLLAPFAGRNANQQYKLVTSMDSTTIAYRCGTQDSVGLESSTAGSGYILSISPHSYCYLTATSPIFVVQMAPGGTTDSLGDPAIAIVSPTTGHVNSTSFLNLPSEFFPNNFITVTVIAEHFDPSQIQLDGNPLVCNWNNISNTINDDIVGHGCNATVSAGTHTVSHSGGGDLSVVACGWNGQRRLGYAYLTGLNLQVSEQPTQGIINLYLVCMSIDYSFSFLVPGVIFDEFLPYYDLSGIPGLKELERTQDSHSGPIFIPGSMIYGDEVIRKVFVSELSTKIYSMSHLATYHL